MFGREKDPRQMVRRLGDGREPIDARDDLIAKRWSFRLGNRRVGLAHAFSGEAPLGSLSAHRYTDWS